MKNLKPTSNAGNGTITPEQAEKLRVATLKNIIDKVAAGGIPTAREMDMLRAATEEASEKPKRGRPIKDGREVTETETRKILNQKRAAELDLQMEVLRRERPRREDVLEIVTSLFNELAGIIKATALPDHAKADAVAALREHLEDLAKL